jgi:hypothetical protein
MHAQRDRLAGRRRQVLFIRNIVGLVAGVALIVAA